MVGRERNSQTGWFEYSGRDVPEEVKKHLDGRDDVSLFEDDGNEVTFFSKNSHLPDDLYDEDGEDGFEEYGTISSGPVNSPANLPSSLRNKQSVNEYFPDDIAEIVKAVGVEGDSRNYILQGRLSLSLSDEGPSNKKANPIPLKLLVEEEDRMQSNERLDYPSLEEMQKIEDELQAEFSEDDIEVFGIGFFDVADPEFFKIHIDGVVVRADGLQEEVLEWCQQNVEGQRDDLFRASELGKRDSNWVRMWCD